MPRKQSPKPKPRTDEMADFDRDMERDEALDLQTARDLELIRQSLAPHRGKRQ
jgi:hypothetical protein